MSKEEKFFCVLHGWASGVFSLMACLAGVEFLEGVIKQDLVWGTVIALVILGFLAYVTGKYPYRVITEYADSQEERK